MSKSNASLYDKLHDTLVKFPVTRYLGRIVMFIYRYGFTQFLRHVRRSLKSIFTFTPEGKLPRKEFKKQAAFKFNKDIKFSVLVPLYNTPPKFLKEMINSVLSQSYKNLELVLADGSSEEHGIVGDICKEYAQKDNRVVYKKLSENKGISGNTNACIENASGDYIVLFDHDDILHQAALFYVMKEICEQNADFIYTDETTFKNKPKDAFFPHYKPDFSPDLLRSNNYICHLSVFSRSLLDTVGGFRSECDGSQDYDMVLRLTEKAEKIVHIHKILYYWRAHASSVASDISSKPYVIEAAHKALNDHLKRVGLKGKVENAKVISTYRIRYEIEKEPLVSIIIPNKDHIDDLKKCLDSVLEKSTYKNYEIIIVENNSTEKETFDYYKELETNEKIKVLYWKDKFNFAAICNFGAANAKGEQLLFLNNDIEIITGQWIEELLMFAQRQDVGAVGARLYYPDDTVQHGGVIVGFQGVAGHAHCNLKREDPGFVGRSLLIQNLSAVTAALVMIPAKVFNEAEGFDEGYEVAFNDVDLCMKIREKGYLIVYTPYCEAYHYESKSRGVEDTKEKQMRFEGEVNRFLKKWKKQLENGDPYYNKNLDLKRAIFKPKEE